MSRRPLAIALVALLAAASGAAASEPDTLSDADLVAFAVQLKNPIGKWPAAPGGVVGRHHGAKVILDTRCSDVCPDNTTTVIRYDVQSGPQCRQARGDDTVVYMPMSIAVVPMHFCVPRVLLHKGLVRFMPYSQ